MGNVHVAIVGPSLAPALHSGHKCIESRFTRRRRPPYGRVFRGDQVYFKVSGGGIIGRSRVARVEQFEDLTPAAMSSLRRRYNAAILAPKAYWHARRDCRYGVLIWLERFSPHRLNLPVPRQYGSGWLVLSVPAPRPKELRSQSARSESEQEVWARRLAASSSPSPSS